jgi:hypothetical protein
MQLPPLDRKTGHFRNPSFNIAGIEEDMSGSPDQAVKDHFPYNSDYIQEAEPNFASNHDVENPADTSINGYIQLFNGRGGGTRKITDNDEKTTRKSSSKRHRR